MAWTREYYSGIHTLQLAFTTAFAFRCHYQVFYTVFILESKSFLALKTLRHHIKKPGNIAASNTGSEGKTHLPFDLLELTFLMDC